jgi:hypothetical protein
MHYYDDKNYCLKRDEEAIFLRSHQSEVDTKQSMPSTQLYLLKYKPLET